MKRKLLWLGLGIAVAIMCAVTSASAHHPEIAATSSCDDDLISVDIDVTSWEGWFPGSTGDERVNNSVQLSVRELGGTTESVIDVAALTGPTFAFSRTWMGALPNTTYVFTARALVEWGPLEDEGSAGEQRSVQLTTENGCAAPPSTTTTVVTTLPPITSTIPVAPTTVPTEVSGQPELPPVQLATPQLAMTGPTYYAKVGVVVGVTLFIMGICLLLMSADNRRTGKHSR